jgi:hypothetical protein
MRPGAVAVVHPLIKGPLSRLQIHESCPASREFGAHTAVEAFDLAGSGRAARLGQKVLDPAFPADSIKEHLDRRMVEPAGEYLAVIGQDLLGCPIGQQRAAQNRRRPRGCAPEPSTVRTRTFGSDHRCRSRL